MGAIFMHYYPLKHMQTLTVKVLSPVQSESDVFDNLVEVQRLDTMEIGTLLCSHCCRWPAHLIDKATWIEGCYTPSHYELDARLLMGYHPQTMTCWEFEQKGDEVFVHLTVDEYVSHSGDFDGDEYYLPPLQLDGCMPLPMSRVNERPTHMEGTRTYRHLRRLWREINRTREGGEALLVFFRTAYAMVDSGALDELAVASCMECIPEVARAMTEAVNEYALQFGRQRPLFNTPTEVYADGVRVVNNAPSQGYLPAVTLVNQYQGRRRRRRGENHSRYVVSNAAALWDVPGYAVATPVSYYGYDEDEYGDANGPGYYVTADVPEMGFYRAVELDCLVRYSDGSGTFVDVCDARQGYWIADPIV